MKQVSLIAALLAFALPITATADCFNYRADSYSTTEMLRNIKEIDRQDTGEVLLNSFKLDHVVSHWVGGNAILATRAGASFAPKILIVAPGSNRVIAESWPIEAQGGYQYAEVQIDGRRLHAAGTDGHVNVVFTSESRYASASSVPEGILVGWMHMMERQRGGNCNPRWVDYNGGGACDLNCGGTIPQQDCPLGQSRLPDGTCPF